MWVSGTGGHYVTCGGSDCPTGPMVRTVRLTQRSDSSDGPTITLTPGSGDCGRGRGRVCVCRPLGSLQTGSL
jgi:hypothetical protein